MFRERTQLNLSRGGNLNPISNTGVAHSPVEVNKAELIQADLAELLFQAGRSNFTISFAVALIFFIVHVSGGTTNDWQVVWFVVMCGLLVSSVLLNILHRRRPALYPLRTWLNAYRLIILCSGLMWGAGGLLFHAPEQMTLEFFTILTIAGIAAGSLGWLASDLITYRFFVWFSLLPLTLVAFLRGDPMQDGIGLLILLLMVLLLNSGFRTATAIRKSLELRYENKDLLVAVENEKNRVINVAETMIGTILQSAPIFLWATDRLGKVTLLDGTLLQEQAGLKLPKADDNLLEFFAGKGKLIQHLQSALNGERVHGEFDIQGKMFELHSGPLNDEDKTRVGAIGVAIDITDRKRQEREFYFQANYDSLTGLANKILAMNKLQQAFDRTKEQQQVTLLMLDLDNFRNINETLGQTTGNELIIAASRRLQHCLHKDNFAARISGDEFIVCAENLSPHEAEALAHKIISVFQDPFVVSDRELFTTASLGVAFFPIDAKTPESLFQAAETALFHAKNNGKSTYQLFTRNMRERSSRHHELETGLRSALARNELKLYYQPKIDIHKQQLCGAEVLLRWQSAALGNIRPDDFIPIAEFAGLMPAIGEWVLRTACREVATWQIPTDRDFHVAINVSPQQFRKTELLAEITQALVEAGLSSDLIELEITESLLVQDSGTVERVLDDLHDMGISLALDDFGTGYSSLSYLRKFPINVLKIDKAFVNDLGKDPDSESLINAIISLAHSLKLKTVAEGVETAQQLAFLKQRGVDMVQGWYFSRPLPAEEFTPLLLDSQRFNHH